MPLKPVSLDHVNIFVRNAGRSHQWYTDILGLHTQDIFHHPGTEKMRAAFLACDPDHAHDIALFEGDYDLVQPSPLDRSHLVDLANLARLGREALA